MVFTGRLTNVIYSQLTMRRLLITKIALLRHRAATGSLPPTLSDLVPNHLDTVPLDCFDGAPLRYDAARGAIWSIGENLIDEGGAATPSPGALKIGTLDPTMFAQP